MPHSPHPIPGPGHKRINIENSCHGWIQICYKQYSISLRTVYNNCLMIFKITFSAMIIVFIWVSWKQILRPGLSIEGFLGNYSQKESRIGQRERLTYRAAPSAHLIGSSGGGKALLSSLSRGKWPRALYPDKGPAIGGGHWKNGKVGPWCQGQFLVRNTIVSNWYLEFSCKQSHFKALGSLTCFYMYLHVVCGPERVHHFIRWDSVSSCIVNKNNC